MSTGQPAAYDEVLDLFTEPTLAARILHFHPSASSVPTRTSSRKHRGCLDILREKGRANRIRGALLRGGQVMY